MTNQDCRSALAGLAHLLLRGRGAGAQVPLAAGAGRKQAGGRSCFLSLESLSESGRKVTALCLPIICLQADPDSLIL